MKTVILFVIMLLSILATIAVVGWIFYRLVKQYFKNQQKQQLLQLERQNNGEVQRIVTPIRLQAYERIALFLERISPNSLVLRCYQPGMDLKLLQGVMTKNIRDEWEHNLSQQVYVSSNLWTHVREAKDEMINLVNSSAVQLADTTDPTRLAATIFASSAEHSPVEPAISVLHKEIHQLFG